MRDKAVHDRAIETVKEVWRWYVDEYYPDESWDETMGYILDAVEAYRGEADDSSQNKDA